MGECVEFDGWLDRDGYGQTRERIGGSRRAHRVAWFEAHGPIPEGMFVCHSCDNPSCVNVEHLFLGTCADNNRDMRSKDRHANAAKTHCKHGHEFTDDNTYINPGSGKRQCRACEEHRNRNRKR